MVYDGNNPLHLCSDIGNVSLRMAIEWLPPKDGCHRIRDASDGGREVGRLCDGRLSEDSKQDMLEAEGLEHDDGRASVGPSVNGDDGRRW